MFLKGVWFIIAGVLLLGHTPLLAEPYLRVCKDGVVYYYFNSREPTQPGQAGKNTPKLRGEAWVQVPSPPACPLAVKAPLRVASQVKPEAVSSLGDPALMPLMPETAEDLQVVNPYDAKSMILAGTDHLLRLLTKLGCRYPLALPAAAAGIQRVGRHADVPAEPAPQIVAPEGWKNLLEYAQATACRTRAWLWLTSVIASQWLAPFPSETPGATAAVGGGEFIGRSIFLPRRGRRSMP